MVKHRFRFRLRTLHCLTAVAFWLSGTSGWGGELSDLSHKQAQQRAVEAREARRRAKSPTARREDKKRAAKHEAAARQGSATAPPNAEVKPEISEVGIEQTGGGWGLGPDYTFLVNDDCTFRYEGRRHVERIGQFTGKVPRETFEEVAQLVRDSDYLGLNDRYWRKATDVGAVYTTAVMNGKRKVILNWEISDAPKKLSAIQDRIDGLLEQAEWDEKREQADEEE